MRFSEVNEKFLADPAFRDEVRQAARQALRDGVESAAWQRLAGFFAENATELALLTPPRDTSTSFDPAHLTRMLLATDSDTGAGTTTTTTTTTSRLCSLPGICERPLRQTRETSGKSAARKSNKATAKKTR